MEPIKFIWIKIITWSPKSSGYQEKYDIQPQYDDNIIKINLENIDEST